MDFSILAITESSTGEITFIEIKFANVYGFFEMNFDLGFRVV